MIAWRSRRGFHICARVMASGEHSVVVSVPGQSVHLVRWFFGFAMIACCASSRLFSVEHHAKGSFYFVRITRIAVARTQMKTRFLLWSLTPMRLLEFVIGAFEMSLSDGRRPNEIAGANTGLRFGFAEKSLVVLNPWPGVARLNR